MYFKNASVTQSDYNMSQYVITSATLSQVLGLFFCSKNALENVLTGVIKGREGEGIVCQRLEKIRDIAPVPKQELVR